NEANWRAHFETTGPEIWEQTRGGITHLVACLGTTGTFVGVGRFLRQRDPRVRLVAVQPDGPFHGIEGVKHLESSRVPGIWDPKMPDEVLAVATEDAQRAVRRLAREECRGGGPHSTIRDRSTGTPPCRRRRPGARLGPSRDLPQPSEPSRGAFGI